MNKSLVVLSIFILIGCNSTNKDISIIKGTRLIPLNQYKVSFSDGTKEVSTNYFYDTERKEKCSIHYINGDRPAYFTFGIGYQANDEIFCLPDAEYSWEYSDDKCSIPVMQNKSNALYGETLEEDNSFHIYKKGMMLDENQPIYYIHNGCNSEEEKSASEEYSFLGEEVSMHEFVYANVSVIK
jgi:hypothetical protein